MVGESWRVKNVVCERWCVQVVCERQGVTKLCVKVVCERKGVTKLCVKDGVWQSCVWKMVCDKVVCENGVWQSCVYKMVWELAPELLQEALCTAPTTQKAAAGQRRPRAPQLLQEALCAAPATQKAAAGQRRPRAPQLRQEALCILTAPATQKATAGQRRPRAPQLLGWNYTFSSCFLLLLLLLLLLRLLLFKRHLLDGKTPWQRRTEKHQNCAQKLPNVTSETHRKGCF